MVSSVPIVVRHHARLNGRVSPLRAEYQAVRKDQVYQSRPARFMLAMQSSTRMVSTGSLRLRIGRLGPYAARNIRIHHQQHATALAAEPWRVKAIKPDGYQRLAPRVRPSATGAAYGDGGAGREIQR